MTHNVIKLTIEHESAVDLFLFQISAYIAKQSSGITSPKLFKFLRHILKSVIDGKKGFLKATLTDGLERQFGISGNPF